MPTPRKRQISLDATPFYHCVSRCVRRAFLCGKDPVTDRSYEHRRQQLEDNALRLTSIFFIEIAAIAVMSNHYHTVLHVNKHQCLQASPRTIVERWHLLFGGTEVSKKFLNHETIEPHEREQLDTLVDSWRQRLFSISWFMRVLNETTARNANKEDDCTGHFWESRFKSQALLDDQAVLSAMAYVDLNPVRAAMASTPEESDFTSIQRRIQYFKNKLENSSTTGKSRGDDSDDNLQPDNLMPFAGNPRQPMPHGIPFNLIDYINLVDWTGRQIRDNKRGAIDAASQSILVRLGISPEHWVYLCTNYESKFKGIVGSKHSLATLCKKFGHKRKSNFSNSCLLFS